MLDSYLSTAGVVLPFLLKGFWETLKISFVAIIAGSLLGFVIGVIRSYRIRGVHQVLGLYIHVLRGTPFLVQLYIFYFVLPSSGIELLHWDSGTAAFVSLSVYTSCYVAEIVMGAIQSVPRGQTEGAMTLGLRPLQILRLVVLPQAMRLIVQPMSGVYVMLIKSTAILSVVGITELTRQGEVFIITFPAKSLFIYGMIAAIYFIYCYPLLRLANWLEKRLTGGLQGAGLH
ncbi:amino acid ABC transporter permease [Streptomyces cavourensis]|jgi:polar amino acid transport system permease protein|uniref:amino acid ABC transporter permease n=1 Tax=unclassified Achromobacter TaxID=2626865 RepID=UPI000E069F8D|nr:amino acid ABC transporter permease [Streptomyces cavourensis]